MFVRSRDHIDKNVSAQDICDKRDIISPTLKDKTDVELRVLMSCAAIQLHRNKLMRSLKLKSKHIQEEKFAYEYSSYCFLPRKLVVKKGNHQKIYDYYLFNNDGRSLLKTAQSLSTRNEGYKLLKCMGFVRKEAWKVESPETFTKCLDTLIRSTLGKSVLQSDKLDISSYYIAKINDDRVDLFSSFNKEDVNCESVNNEKQLGNLLLMWNFNGVLMDQRREKLCVILNFNLEIEQDNNMRWKHNFSIGEKFIIDDESLKFSIIEDKLIDGDENGDEDGKVDGGDDDDYPDDQQQEDEEVPDDDAPDTTLREVPPTVLTKVIKLYNISMLYYFNNNLSLYHNQRISHDQLSPLKKTQNLVNLSSPFDSTMKSPPLQISGIIDLCKSPSETSAVQSTLAPQMEEPIYTLYPVELESQVDLYVSVYSLSIRREARLHRLLSTRRM